MSGLRRRRAQSSSRAEEIVTAELRARRAQPDRPVHRAADSLLSWASAAPLHTRGLVNWAGLLLALSGARLVLENLLTYGLRVSAAGWATFLLGAAGQPHHYPVLYLLAALHLPLLATLHLERLLSAGRLAASTATGLHCATLVLVFALPVLLINLPALKFGLVSAVLACGGYCVIGLKLVSYIQVNSWCRSPRAGRLAREKSYVTPAELRRGGEAREGEEEAREKGGLVTYPDNLSLRDLYYFMLAPTLCYELNFPRTTRIRKTFLLRRLLEVVLLTQLVLALTQQWIIPDLLNSLVPFSRTDLPVATERLIRLSLPNHIIWLLGGYLVFHSCLNISGEVLHFADRQFYRDWWNSPNFSRFWQDWNLPVHRWFLRHLYKPLVAAGWSRTSAVFLVFLVSSLLHEYTVSVPLRILKPWLFLGFMCNVPLVQLSSWLEARLGARAGNLSMWLFLVMGQPLLVMTYYHDYVVEHHGPALIHHYGHLNSTQL